MKQKMPIQEKVDLITCLVCVFLMFGLVCMYMVALS
jgi:hypothetical protein